jgi:hypothetical protein
MPLEVMVQTMRYFFAEAEKEYAKKFANDPQYKKELVEENLVQACEFAEKAAPYLHQRLAAIQISSDKNLEHLEDDQIQQLRTLLITAVESAPPVAASGRGDSAEGEGSDHAEPAGDPPTLRVVERVR